MKKPSIEPTDSGRWTRLAASVWLRKQHGHSWCKKTTWTDLPDLNLTHISPAKVIWTSHQVHECRHYTNIKFGLSLKWCSCIQDRNHMTTHCEVNLIRSTKLLINQCDYSTDLIAFGPPIHTLWLLYPLVSQWVLWKGQRDIPTSECFVLVG